MSWISEDEFVEQTLRKYAYTFPILRDALKFHQLHGGEFWTEHSEVGNRLAYDQGIGGVDVLGYVIILESKVGGQSEDHRVWWPGSPE